MRRLVLVFSLAMAAGGCGDEPAPSDGHDARRPQSADERVLADRYRAVARSLAEANAEAICGVAIGAAARTFGCDRAAGRPRVPKEFRSLAPDLAGLYVYPDLDALILGAPLRGRDDRLFVRFERQGPPGSWPIESVLVGYSG